MTADGPVTVPFSSLIRDLHQGIPDLTTLALTASFSNLAPHHTPNPNPMPQHSHPRRLSFVAHIAAPLAVPWLAEPSELLAFTDASRLI